MNIIEALHALQDGKKIRKKEWCQDWFIFMSDNFIRDYRGVLFSIGVSGRKEFATEWELYAEPVHITPEERKALELAKACGFTGVYRVEFITAHTGVVFVVETPGKSFECLVSNVPAWSFLQDAKWITTDDRLSIDELLKGGAE